MAIWYVPSPRRIQILRRIGNSIEIEIEKITRLFNVIASESVMYL